MDTKRELELKDICGYLPHGLKFLDISFVEKNGYEVLDTYCYNCESLVAHNDIRKPILYPLSALYEPYMYKGEEIIPIIKCAMLATGLDYWALQESNNYAVYDTDYEYYEFGFINGGFDYFVNSYNQIKPFDFLNELKIDYRGLIDSGLAISVYDLETNPYK